MNERELVTAMATEVLARLKFRHQRTVTEEAPAGNTESVWTHKVLRMPEPLRKKMIDLQGPTVDGPLEVTVRAAYMPKLVLHIVKRWINTLVTDTMSVDYHSPTAQLQIEEFLLHVPKQQNIYRPGR